MEDDCTQDKSPSSNVIFKIKTINQILSTRKPRATSTSTTLTPRKTKTNTKKPAPKNNYKII